MSAHAPALHAARHYRRGLRALGPLASHRRSLGPLAGLVLSLLLAACGQPAAPAAQGAQGAPGAPLPTPTTAAVEEVAPPPSAAQVAAGVQATVVFNAAAAQDKVDTERVRVYRSRAGVALQDYANALGKLRDKDREVAERPTLIDDAVWLFRTREAMQLMQSSASRLTSFDPIPPEMAVTAQLVQQLDGDTRLLTREYGLGIDSASPAALATAASRTTPLSVLLARANLELRRGAA